LLRSGVFGFPILTIYATGRVIIADGERLKEFALSQSELTDLVARLKGLDWPELEASARAGIPDTPPWVVRYECNRNCTYQFIVESKFYEGAKIPPAQREIQRLIDELNRRQGVTPDIEHATMLAWREPDQNLKNVPEWPLPESVLSEALDGPIEIADASIAAILSASDDEFGQLLSKRWWSV